MFVVLVWTADGNGVRRRALRRLLPAILSVSGSGIIADLNKPAAAFAGDVAAGIESRDDLKQ